MFDTHDYIHTEKERKSIRGKMLTGNVLLIGLFSTFIALKFKINCGKKRAKGKRRERWLIWKLFKIIPCRRWLLLYHLNAMLEAR